MTASRRLEEGWSMSSSNQPIVFILSSLALLASGPSMAQSDAPPDTGGLEEVVVTAQKRAENIQSVPIAVTAVTGETISTQAINNVQGLANSIPNVQINSFANSPDSAVFTIRGIGVNDADPYVGTTVSVVVDGVVVGINTAALLSLFDIDRVEVLRGPQGTLFGANTTGGVINVVTKQPTGEFGGEAQVLAGNHGRIDVNAALNFPIADNLAGKFTVLHMEHDGYFRNTLDGGDLGGLDITSLRGYLKYDRDSYDATLIGEYVRSRNGSQTGINFSDMSQALAIDGVTNTGSLRHVRGHSPDQPDQNNRDTYGITLTQNFDTSFGDVVSITSYREYDSDLYSDDDATELVLLQTRRQTKHEQYSQELRATFDLNEHTQLLVGAFGFAQEYFLDQDGKLDGFVVGLGQPQTQEQKNWSASLFSQLYRNLTDRLRLQAGLRYTHEKTKATSTTANTFSLTGGYSSFDDTFILPGTFIAASGEESWGELGYKLGLDYRATDTTMFYGYYARGFKSGGFTGRIALPQDIGPFDPEFLDTYEVGVKSDLLENRLRANLAIFYNLYEDMQVTQNITYTDGRNSASIVNAGKAKSKGVELELTALPVTGLTLSAGVAYLDAKYSEYDTQILDPALNRLVPISYAGNRLMNSPEWSATASLDYTVSFGAGEANIFIQNNYTSSKYTGFAALPQELIGSINLVNAAVSWRPSSESWSIGLYGRNILDREYYGQKLYLPGVIGLGSLGAPREYGVDFSYRW